MSPLSTCVLGVRIDENFAILGPDGITVRKFPIGNQPNSIVCQFVYRYLPISDLSTADIAWNNSLVQNI